MGYPPEFCSLISQELSTDFTAGRMLGYLRNFGRPSMEEVADEMLAILSDRQRIVEKKIMENTQAKWNMTMARGFDDEEEKQEL